MSLGYKIIYDEVVLRLLKKLDKQTSKKIINWLIQRLSDCEDPRMWGAALKGDFGEFWRYRIGNYRVLCKILDMELIVLILEINHRKDIYCD